MKVDASMLGILGISEQSGLRNIASINLLITAKFNLRPATRCMENKLNKVFVSKVDKGLLPRFYHRLQQERRSLLFFPAKFPP